MNRRSGTTLIEVLVAIFVMGLGLIALLTLFPIGALRMAQAIHDDRCALCAQNAFATAVMQNIRYDQQVVTSSADLDDPLNRPIADMFANPSARPSTAAFLHPNADPYGASYAVWVDPIGYYAVPNGINQYWVGGVRGGLRRCPVGFANPPGTKIPQRNLNIYQSFTLWDDINFDGIENPGTPQVAAGTTRVFRDSRFSWTYLLRRRQTSQTSAVDCTVVVFDNRTLALTGNLTLREHVYSWGNPTNPGTNPSYFDPNKNIITIDYTNNVPPPVRPGSWILDASIYYPTATAGAGNLAYTSATQHAYFYRVVAVLDEIVIPGAPARTLAQYEVQTSLRDFPPGPPPPAVSAPYQAMPYDSTTGFNLGYKGTAIVIDGIAEVYEKGPVRPAP